MDALEAESVDLIVTSPPYNLGLAYKSYDDHQSREEYLEWTRTWITSAKRILKENGSLFLNLGASPSNPFLPFEVICSIRNLFHLQNTIHWVKSITVETRTGETISAGHFKPINSRRFLNDCHEYVFHLTKSGNTPLDRLSVGVPYTDKSNITRWGHTGGRDRRCRGNTWFIPYETIKCRQTQRPHPATFPVQLVRNCIKLHGATQEASMLDPFVGIGSAAIAAIREGVASFRGIDVDVDYCSLARERVARELDRIRCQQSLCSLESPGTHESNPQLLCI